jgi:hypothetical protein
VGGNGKAGGFVQALLSPRAATQSKGVLYWISWENTLELTELSIINKVSFEAGRMTTETDRRNDVPLISRT